MMECGRNSPTKLFLLWDRCGIAGFEMPLAVVDVRGDDSSMLWKLDVEVLAIMFGRKSVSSDGRLCNSRGNEGGVGCLGFRRVATDPAD